MKVRTEVKDYFLTCCCLPVKAEGDLVGHFYTDLKKKQEEEIKKKSNEIRVL